MFSGWGAGFETDNHTVGHIGDLIQQGAGGVPEPATWALMIVGFCGMGAALRNARRRALPTFAA